MFENKLAVQLQTEKDKLDQMDNRSSIWLEDESQRIGSVNIPQPLWDKMRNSSVYFLDIPFEQRLRNIVNEYGNLDKENMIDAIIRIRKRLGGLETKMAIQHLQEEKTRESFRLLLNYYDRHYLKGLNNRNNHAVTVQAISSNTTDPISNSEKLLQVKYSSAGKLTLN
jgi:tRNA 2-selenouridine synthase